MNEIKTGYGFKFLAPYGATIYEGREFFYNLPKNNEKWGEWTEHPNPLKYDGKDCGPGRLHVMKKLSADYAPTNWWPWFVQWEGLIGESKEKIGVRKLRLRRITKKVFHKIIKLGYCKGANLRNANLRNANLRNADLRDADLRDANLRYANLICTDLRYANLICTDLRYANLEGADLRNVNLINANLINANLRYANLRYANLRNADLRDANLRDANLINANLINANLRNAYLTGADLRNAIGFSK